MDIVAIALRTADKLILQLGFKSARVMEPPFKPVIVLAVKVVDDHVFIRGAGTGIEQTALSIAAQWFNSFYETTYRQRYRRLLCPALWGGEDYTPAEVTG